MKKWQTVIVVSFLCLSLFSVPGSQVKASGQSALDVAEKAATYVMSRAVPEAGGYKWIYYTGYGQGLYSPTLSSGASGVGMFFLLLYEKTGNSVYLDYAEGAATWLISKAIPASGGYKWATPDQDRPDWYLTAMWNGASGIGEFFLEMYKATQDSVYLDYAKGAAQWMIANAVAESGGCFIPYNPPGKYGSQAAHGISQGREARTMTFILHLYQETNGATYLPYITGMAQWLMATAISEGGGYKWTHNIPYGTDYPIGGMAEVASYFYDVYRELGGAAYLSYANGAVQWILDQAVVAGDTAKWPRAQGGAGPYNLIDGYGLPIDSYGAVSDVLLTAYEVTSNPTYLDYAKKQAQWMINQAVSQDGGFKFPSYEGGTTYNAHANSMIYSFLLRMYGVTNDATYPNYANGVLSWIVSSAVTTDSGYKWQTGDVYDPYPAIWWGAAGIGYNLATTLIVPADKTAVMIDPFYAQENPIDRHNADSARQYVSTCLAAAGYSFTWVHDQSVTVEWLKNNLAHGVVFWRGHGGLLAYGVAFATAEEYTAQNIQKYAEDRNANRIAAMPVGGVSYIAITPGFIDYYYKSNGFPNSLIYAETCNSLENTTMATAFMSCGAGAYMGYPCESHYSGGIFALLGLSLGADSVSKASFWDFCVPGYDVKQVYDDQWYSWITAGFFGCRLSYYGDPNLRLTSGPLKVVRNIALAVDCPVDLCVIDPQGRHLGFDPATAEPIEEIPNAIYAGFGTNQQAIWIPDILEGTYDVELLGCATGNFTFVGTISSPFESTTQTYEGTITRGEILTSSATVSATNSSITVPTQLGTPECAATATGTGEVCLTPSHGTVEGLQALPTIPPSAPVGIVFPHGMFSFKITGLDPGQEVAVTIELPQAAPVGTRWWKYQSGSWYSLPIGSDDGDNIIWVTLKDRQFPGDADGIDGQITDPGGPGTGGAVGWETYSISKVRVLLPWIALVAAIMAGAILLGLRRRRAQS